MFDAPGKTFRDDWYPQYKANRPAMPDDLARQIEPLHELVRAHGWPLLMVEGVEADDVIGTLAEAREREGIDTLISTSDKDLAQLVEPGITLVNTMSNETLDEAGVVAKFGVRADQVLDLLALTGDDRQRAGRAEGRSEDRREVARRNTARSTPSSRTPARSAASSARTCARRSTGCRRASGCSR